MEISSGPFVDNTDMTVLTVKSAVDPNNNIECCDGTACVCTEIRAQCEYAQAEEPTGQKRIFIKKPQP